MSDNDSVPDEIQDLINDIFQRRYFFQHRIGNVGLLLNEWRQGDWRLDEDLLLHALHDRIVADDDAAEFNYVIIFGA